MTRFVRNTEVKMSEWKKVSEIDSRRDILRKEAQETLKSFVQRVEEMIRTAQFQDDFAQSLWVELRPHAEAELQKLKRMEVAVSVGDEAQFRRFNSIVRFSATLLNCQEGLAKIEVLSEAAQLLLKRLKHAQFVQETSVAPLLHALPSAEPSVVDWTGQALWEIEKQKAHLPSRSVDRREVRIPQRRIETTPAQAGVILWV